MPSFDIVSEVNLQEVANAIHQTIKEIETRYDFKHSKCKVELDKADITLTADDDYKRELVIEVMKEKMVRRKVDTRTLQYADVEPASGGLVRQKITIRQGVEQELAKKIIKHLKESKLKVQGSIVGDQVRVNGKQRDELQAAIELVKGGNYDLPLQFINFRE